MPTDKQPSLQIVVSPNLALPPDLAPLRAAALGGKSEAMARNAAEALSELGSVLKDATASFMQSLESIAPNEVELELNLSLEAEGNWLIVSGKAGATVGVTLTWRRE